MSFLSKKVRGSFHYAFICYVGAACLVRDGSGKSSASNTMYDIVHPWSSLNLHDYV